MQVEELIRRFIAYYRTLGKSEYTCRNYRYNLYRFFKRSKLSSLPTVPGTIVRFISEEGKAPATNYTRYVVLSMFFKWAYEEGLILINLMDKVPCPQIPSRLPTRVMTQGEAEKLLAVYEDNPNRPYEYRNRLMLELMYSCSLRRSEVITLQLKDYDPELRQLKVRQNKTRIMKVVPVGEQASNMLDYYLAKIRPQSERVILFLNQRKEPITPEFISKLVAQARKKSGIRTKASSHSLRKTSATHMLRNGARIETVQKLLGHERMRSTEVYTKIYPLDLIRMHRARHPREKQKNIELPELKVPFNSKESIPFKR